MLKEEILMDSPLEHRRRPRATRAPGRPAEPSNRDQSTPASALVGHHSSDAPSGSGLSSIQAPSRPRRNRGPRASDVPVGATAQTTSPASPEQLVTAAEVHPRTNRPQGAVRPKKRDVAAVRDGQAAPVALVRVREERVGRRGVRVAVPSDDTLATVVEPTEAAACAPSSEVIVPSRKNTTPPPKSDNAGLVERLTRGLSKGQYECMICMTSIGKHGDIWQCRDETRGCFAVFHLTCIKAWIKQMNSQHNQQHAHTTFGSTPHHHRYSTQHTSHAAHQSSSSFSTPAHNTVLSWRCPGCQYMHQSLSFPKYMCFCGKVTEPDFRPGVTPHSCGDPCSRPSCIHGCPYLCHPGPCPPCTSLDPTPVKCACGKSSKRVKCGDVSAASSTGRSSDVASYTCDNVCGRKLNCGAHSCTLQCHQGPCMDCQRISETIFCACGKKSKNILCGQSHVESFACTEICHKLFPCGVHKCDQPCHPGPCLTPSVHTDSCISADQGVPDSHYSCPFDPRLIGQSCVCGSETNPNPRTKCTDPLFECTTVCKAELPSCGHSCEIKCCPGKFSLTSGTAKIPCDSSNCEHEVLVGCRCGRSKEKVTCGGDLGRAKQSNILCNVICKTRKTCGRHKCERSCCESVGILDSDIHVCLLPCGKPLQCGLHTCDSPCHLGKCRPCAVVNRRPLTCACGSASIPPPTVCGTAPPRCLKPCDKVLPCGKHKCRQTCHFGECPVCTELVSTKCAGGHRDMHNIRCHIAGSTSSQTHAVTSDSHVGASDPSSSVSKGGVSCGQRCGKPLPCGHNCKLMCHSGECPTTCTQPCIETRTICKHICASPCHVGKPCPTNTCPAKVKILCECGLRQKERVCGVVGHGRCVSCAEPGHGPDEPRDNQSEEAYSDSDNYDQPISLFEKLPCDSHCAAVLRQARLKAAFAPNSKSATESNMQSADALIAFFTSSSSSSDPTRNINPISSLNRYHHNCTRYPRTLVELGRKWENYIRLVEPILKNTVEQGVRSPVFLPQGCASRRHLIKEYATQYFGLECWQDGARGQMAIRCPNMAVPALIGSSSISTASSQTGSISRVSVPSPSIVDLLDLPTEAITPFVFEFTTESPSIVLYDVPRTGVTSKVVQTLPDMLPLFRCRRVAEPGNRNSVMMVDFVDLNSSMKAFERFKAQLSYGELRNCRLINLPFFAEKPKIPTDLMIQPIPEGVGHGEGPEDVDVQEDEQHIGEQEQVKSLDSESK